MLKKQITITDDETGEERVETHYFNFSKAEMIQMQFKKGGLVAYFDKIQQEGDQEEQIEAFKRIILDAYGIKTHEGKFKKTASAREEFASSEAFSELFVELFTEEGAAVAFVQGVMPKGMQPMNTPAVSKSTPPDTGAVTRTEPTEHDLTEPPPGTPMAEQNPTQPAPPQLLTKAEAMEMDAHVLREGLIDGRFILQG